MRPNLQPKIYKSPVVAQQLYHMYATTRYNFVRLKATHKIPPLRRVGGGRSPPQQFPEVNRYDIHVAHFQLTIKELTIFLFFLFISVYYRPCSSCPALSMFEGQSKCLLNLGTYLVGYDVLRSYMHSFLHGRYLIFILYINQ